VGNVPIETKEKELLQYFKTSGPIESLRFRSIPYENPLKSKNLSARLNEISTHRTSKSAYICFKKEESARAALEKDNCPFASDPLNCKHLRVDLLDDSKKKFRYAKTTVLVGNLPIYTEEEELRQAFRPCGRILSVRVIRDSSTNLCKGVAYVSFADKDGQEKALQQNEKLFFMKKKVRVSLFKKSKLKNNMEARKEGTGNATDKMNFEKSTSTSGRGRDRANRGRIPARGRQSFRGRARARGGFGRGARRAQGNDRNQRNWQKEH